MKRISNKLKVILFLLVATVMTLIGLNLPTKAADENGKITVTKSATKSVTAADIEKYPYLTEENLQKGRYAKVNLNVSAQGYTVETESISTLDIVLVFDSSNSMDEEITIEDENGNEIETTRMEAAKAAATDFATTLMANNDDVQISIVEFGTQVLDVQALTNDENVVINFIDTKLDLPSNSANGGTNLQAGIEYAETILASGRTDSKKIVIILTDGTPTYFNYNGNRYGSGQANGSNSLTCVEVSNRNCTKSLSPISAATEELNELKSTYTTTDVYTIAFADSNAATALSTINPESAADATPLYKNYAALSGVELQEKFSEIVENAKEIVGTSSKLTDIIPAEFQLPESEVERLESLGIEVTVNGDGTTTLVYDIGNIEAGKNYNLEFVVEAKPAYYGTVYTNESATLETTIDATNPYYCANATEANPCDTSLEISVDNPKVEIPTITNSDSYGDVGYAEENITISTSILTNDSIKSSYDENYSVTGHTIVIIENDSVQRIGTTDQYTIVGKGTLTVNQDGTFSFVSLEGVSGEITFDYYVATYTEDYDNKETAVTYSNSSTVSFNIQERELIDIEGIKTWVDNNDQDGKRPESITIHLYKNGEYVISKTVTAADNWSYSFTDLYKYEVGAEGTTEIIYTVTEDEVVGYTTKIDGYNVTNTHEIEKVSVSGIKTWDDNNDQDGKRPESVTINLLANGKEVKEVIVTADTNWSYTFTDLNKYESGEEIVYTITEDEVVEYTTVINGYNVTNSHTPEVITISGEKTWIDNNNQDGKRPESITINLLANGKEVKEVIVTADNNWSYTFTNLPKYANGEVINYTITEDAVAEYTTVIDGYNVKNTHEIEKTEISGTKTWDDNNDQDGKRPESITINLLANGKEVKEVIVTADTNWSYTFTDLNKYESGEEIVYTITEDEVVEYTTVINGYNVTNSHTPEVITISGEKTWIDNDNQDGKRPSSITINLLANGEIVTSIPVTEASGWGYTFTNLPKYANGEVINYTITEDEVAEYTTVIDGYNVTNTHEIEKTEISGTKTWDDNNDQDGKRPESITINLLANGKEVKEVIVTADTNWSYTFTDLNKYESGEEIVYTITEDEVVEYTTVVNGYNVTNSHTPEVITISGEKTWIDNDNQDGKRPSSITINLLANGEIITSIPVTEASNWGYTFTNLPKYVNGEVINYTITEEAVEYYETEIDGYNVTNSHIPEVITISGEKTWIDNDNQDGKRPSSITINLLANGEIVTSIPVTEASNWGYTFTNLPKYANGEIINYTITEEAVEYYETVIDGYNVKNTHEIEKIEISGTKTWDDNNDQDGKRPESVTINLLANGKEVKEVTITELDNWSYTFEDLDKYENGVEIVYTITEDAVAEYTTVIDGYNVTNSHTPEVITISGEKTWIDNDNQDGKRPSSITINLLANGQEIRKVPVTEASDWGYTFTNLPKYANGEVINYTITEDAVAEYTTVIDEYNVTNTHEIEKVTVSGTKTWDDNNDQDGKRPESITIHLYKNGEYFKTSVVNKADDWKYEFTDLDKYENGQEIVYTITEDKVVEYTTVINGYDITNTHEIEKIEISGTKTWDDANNQDGKRPESIIINLLADGEIIDSKEVTAETNWAYEFTNLDRYESGKEIVYTITENEVDEYTTVVNGYDVTNKYTPETVTISGTKTWDDENNQDGIRPNSITVNLLADGEIIDSKEVTAETNWAYEFTELDRYKNGGTKIVYTITEDEVEGYTTEINGYNIKNIHEVEKVAVSGSKIWDDNNDQDGIRPNSITVNLLADGEFIDTVTVTAETNWKYEFTDLDKNKEGKEIVYTITEEAVAGYTTKIDGYNVTNTHTPETIVINGTKTWADNNNQDGIRPSSITVRLYADGEEKVALPVTQATNWGYTFSNLPKYRDGGIEIVYTISEDAVEGYETIINGFNISNVHDAEVIDINGIKIWNDANNQDGVRPESIRIRLYADGVEVSDKIVTSETDWTYTFESMPKFNDGVEVKYTVTEDVVAGYTTEIDGYNVTNTHEVELISISGTKTWNDANNQDGKRPTEITVNLLADGEIIASKVVSADDNWTYTFDNLPKYRDGGVEVKYTVDEEPIKGYTSNVDGYNITNTYTPEVITISGTKTWDDANNQDGKRPLNISINLYANGEATGKVVTIDADDNWKYEFTNLPKYANGEIINYTITEDVVVGYTTKIDGFNITNSYTPEKTEITVTKEWKDADNQDGMRPESITVNLLANDKVVQTVKVTAETNWTHTFENLDKYSNGEIINYTITEDAVESYETIVDGYNITNTHTPITLSITGEKQWVDNNDEAGFRPESVIINLLADGEIIDTVTVTVETNWTYTFENLPMYKEGKEINYTVTEEAVEHYETSYDSENPYIVVNTHNPSKITVSGTKTWDDNNNQDGIRPESITVNLTGKVGEEIVYKDSKIVSSSDNWKYEFTNLPEYKYGKLIVYTIDENDVEGYSKEVNGYNLINTHTPELITINGSKTWDDNNNQDGIRPESITINLLADNNVVDTKVVSEDTEGNWNFEFNELPKYRDGGIEIKYTVTEEIVDGYESEITDYVITNIHTPETVSYSVNKVWSDYENNDGIRPESITVRLIADGVEIDTQVISEENNWTYSFMNLPKYRDEGTLIVYEFVEDEVKGYTTTIESSVDVNNPNNTIVIVTNTHEKEQSLITINKIWEDYNNKYGKRPESITIHLYADGELVETITITEESDWTAILSKDKYKNGVEIYYTIDEEEVAEYLTTIDGYTVTNKYIVPPHTGIEVDDNQTLYGTVVTLIFSLLGSLFLLKNKLSK